jgi:hypothetical protein
MAIILVLAAVVLGLAIGLSAKKKGGFPWWGKGAPHVCCGVV